VTTNPRPQLRRGFHQPVDYGAIYTSNNEPHGVDLPPSLKTLQCRECGHPVAGLKGCPECERRKAEAAQ
jgi:rubrerythrin